MKENTIYDIARALNLSASTVSRALKDNPVINKMTRKRVNEYASVIGYRSNAFAKNLREQKSNTIGVIVPRLDSDFMSACLAGMEEIASENGYDLLITQSKESKRKEEENSTVLFNKRVDGLLVSLTREDSDLVYFNRFEEKEVPVMFFDRVPIGCKHACPGIDNEQMGYEVGKHLLDQDCRKLLHLTLPTSLGVYLERADGFKRAAEEQPDASAEVIHLNQLNLENGRLVAARIIEKEYDGVFCANDQLAAGCILELQGMGKKIPDDIAVVGFNNDQVSTIVSPHLSTVDYPGTETGRRAMHCLLVALKSEGLAGDTAPMNTALIIRDSSRRKKTL